MKEKIIKEIQEFINRPFKKKDLISFLDKQFNFITQDSINDKFEKNEYNALFDTLDTIKNKYYFLDDNLVCVTVDYSILLVFNTHLEERKRYTSTSIPKFKKGDRVRVVKYGSLVFKYKAGYQEQSDFFARRALKESKWLFGEEPTEDQLKNVKGKEKPNNIYSETDSIWWIDISPEMVGRIGIVETISNTQNVLKYSLKDIEGKCSWYNEEQLELVE
jgi:hypothetical protein